MAITINWGTKNIYVPQSDLTSLGGGVYELDVDQFRLDLKDLEDDEAGMPFPDTHVHNTEVTLSGTTYARFVEIVNGYTVEFEDGQYTVSCTGANHNLADVKTVNQVSLLIGNAAGLVVVPSTESSGSFDDLMGSRVEGSYGDAIHRILWKARGGISSAASTESVDSLETDGTVTAAERTTNFTMTNDESVVFVSFWAKFQGLDASDQCMFEFYEDSLYTRYKVWWDVSAKNFVFTFKDATEIRDITYPSTLLPSSLIDGSNYPVDDTWMHLFFTCHDSSEYMYVNGVLVGQGTNSGGWVPTTAAITTMNCVLGSARTDLPLDSGSSIAQLRFHKGWTDGSAFYGSDKWSRDMDDTTETELWLGWPLIDDGVEITGSGIDLSLDGGTFGTYGLKLY